MKIFKKIFILIMVAVIITTTLVGSVQNNKSINSNATSKQLVKVGVVLSSFDDVYISLVRQSLEKLQQENSDRVEFTYLDGKGNQAIQNEVLDSALQSNYDLLFVNLVDISTDSVESVMNKIKQQNISAILFNIAPFVTNSIKSYKKVIVIATDVEQSGILQGNLVIDAWNNNKKDIDKNGDNILQYIMLTGDRTNTLSIARTKYSISTINDAGIKTQELALLPTAGSQESAQDVIQLALSNYGNGIEAIIANDDTMAIGAIRALQKNNYNNGDKRAYISVFGINGIPEAQDLIKEGFMTGTVVQDSPAMARALYTVGLNLIYNKPPLEGTDYKFDDSGVIIKLPYHPYIY